MQIGGDATVFAPVYGPPFVRDLEGNRRYATIEDFRNFVKLAYMAPSIHHSGGTVCEPVDVPVNKRHLDMIYSHIKYSDKPFMGSVTAPERAEDTVAMAKIVFGDDYVENNTVLTSLINANSPMVFDDTMLGALKVYARHNQACIVTPFILAGAMSPVTVAGTLTQVLAEVLAGAALTQLVRPGAPVLFGTFASSISMQSGAPTFGTPEPSLIDKTGSHGCVRLTNWDATELSWTAPAGRDAAEMKCAYDLDLGEYDGLLVRLRPGADLRVSIYATLDGHEVTLVENEPGSNETQELGGPIHGQKAGNFDPLNPHTSYANLHTVIAGLA
mgnify:CR=1 FL=1